MAHFAEIDENNIVQRVLVVPDSEEHRGQQFLAVDLLLGGTWIQCSYNGNIRKNYPGAGYLYDSERDAFIPPQPFQSWVLDEKVCRWVAPVSHPQDGHLYQWLEPNGWIKLSEVPNV